MTNTIFRGGVDMPLNQNDDIHSGYNDLKQVEMSVQTAQKVVGHATMSMDHGQLNDANEAITNAKTLLQQARSNATGVDEEFLQNQESLLAQTEEQLHEAEQK